MSVSGSPTIDAAAVGLLGRAGREFESDVRGGSMGRTIPDSSRVRIRCEPADRATVGDVIAFRDGDAVVAHRLVARGPARRGHQYLIARGDATILCDAPRAADAVVGRVIAVELDRAWRPVPQASRRRGWRAAAASLLVIVVRTTMQVDVRLAVAVTRAARFARRAYSFARGRPGAAPPST